MSGGDLDPSFGIDGTVVAPFAPPGGYLAQIVAVATQPDGKYVAAGDVGPAPDYGLARYNADGSLDTTFGVSGFVDSRIDLARAAEQFASDLAIQPDGKILEVGSISIIVQETPSGGIADLEVGLARFDASGQLDTSFGVNGYVTIPFLNQTFNPVIALQPDGKIVVVGLTTAQNTGADFQLALARFNADGSLDPSFGTNGMTITAAPSGFSYSRPPGVALQPDGKIVIAAGTSPPDGSNGEFVLARYDASGTLDTTFGQDGLVTTPFAASAAAMSVALEPDGRIIAAGYAGSDFAMARYESSGSLDPSFGQNGVITAPMTAPFSGQPIALQPDGEILAVGSIGGDFGIARFDASGQLDTSFGEGGEVATSFGQLGSSALAVFLQPDGTFTVAGATIISQDELVDEFALARYFIGAPPSVGPQVVTPPPVGPRVVSVQRYGYHARPTKLVLTFDEPLSIVSAQDVRSYQIRGPLGHRVAIVSATYSPRTDTVTLAPRRRLDLHRPFYLTVAGTAPDGVTGLAGTFLNASGPGQPGSDFRTTITAKDLVLNLQTAGSKSRLRKLRHAVNAILAKMGGHAHGSPGVKARHHLKPPPTARST